MNNRFLTNFVKGTKKIFVPVKHFAIENAPEILTGIGIASGVAAIILTNKATVKATKLVEEMKKEDKEKDIPVKEVVKATYKYYVPGACMEVISVACLIGGAAKGRAARAILVASCDSLRNACEDWKETVKAEVPEKFQDIQKVVDEKKVISKAESGDTYIKPTMNGTDIFFDVRTGQYFRSSRKYISECVNSANAILNERSKNVMCTGNDPEDWYGVDELIDLFGENPSDMAKAFGWNLYVHPNNLIDYDISPKTMMINGVEETVHVIRYFAFLNSSFDITNCCNY